MNVKNHTNIQDVNSQHSTYFTIFKLTNRTDFCHYHQSGKTYLRAFRSLFDTMMSDYLVVLNIMHMNTLPVDIL